MATEIVVPPGGVFPDSMHNVAIGPSGRTLSAEEVAAANADTVVLPRETILAEADRITSTDRNVDYGHPLDNHTRTAALWSAYLGVTITAREVCWMNVLQKGSRDRHLSKRDNLVDGAGFLRNAEMVDDERERRSVH